GRHSHEPGILALVGRAGLPGGGQPEAGVADRASRASLDDVFHQAGGEEGDVLVERAAALEGRLPEHVAVRIFDAGDEVGPDAVAAVGERGVGADELCGDDLGGADVDGRV